MPDRDGFIEPGDLFAQLGDHKGLQEVAELGQGSGIEGRQLRRAQSEEPRREPRIDDV